MSGTRNGGLEILLTAWLLVVGVPASLGWSLSSLGWTGVAGPLMLVVLAALAVVWRRRLVGAVREEWAWIRGEKILPVLFLLIVVAGLAYLPAVQDSVSYRIPRIRIWLQDGGFAWIGGSDYRLNTLGRNWEWMGLGILGTTGSERLLVVPSLVSWLVLWRIFASWARELVPNPAIASALVLILATAPLFVAQASSAMNDLCAAGLVAISVHFLLKAWRGRARPGREAGTALLLSGLALALASGVKPNYTVMLPLWLLGAAGWLWGHWGGFPWKSLLWAMPVAVIGSSVPTVALNHRETGYLSGVVPGGEYSVSPASPLAGVLWGHPMFWSLSLQPTFNPLMGPVSRAVEDLEAEASKKVPRFHLLGASFNHGEKATFGLFATFVTLMGCGVGVYRVARGERGPGTLPLLVAAAGVVALSLNLAVAVPHAVGRSSVGFLIPLVPLALWGAGLLEKRPGRVVVQAMAGLSLASALLLMALEPSRPLLGSKGSGILAGKLLGRGSESAQAAFAGYRERTYAGRDLYKMIPSGEAEVGICVDEHTALAEAWRSLAPSTRVRIFRAREVEAMKASGLRYFVVAPLRQGEEETLPDLLGNEGEFEVVARRSYLQQVRRGPSEWLLLRRVAQN